MGGEKNLRATADFALEYGFGLIQIGMDSAAYFPENMQSDKRSDIKSLFEEKDIGLCFHGPADIPLLNRHTDIREAGLNRLCQIIDTAVDMGGEYFIIHTGRLAFYSIKKNKIVFMEKELPEIHLEFFSNAISRITDHANDRIEICIENTHAVPPQFLEIISKALNGNGLGLVWDIVHTEMLDSNNKATQLKFFQENIKHVRLFHLHDATDKGDHKTLGSGRLNLQAYIDIIDTVGADTILEIFPKREVVNSLHYLKSLKATVKPG